MPSQVEPYFQVTLRFFGNSSSLYQNFSLPYQKSLVILSEFFENSLEILLEFIGDVWSGGSECVGVDFG